MICTKGHMHLNRKVKKKQMNNNTISNMEVNDNEIINPKQEDNNIKTEEYYTRIVETGLLGTNLPGKFPHTSKRENKYIFVLYSYNSNAILIRPMKNRTEQEYIKVYQELINYLKQRGLKNTTTR